MRSSHMEMELSARPVWVWIAFALQFLILLSVVPSLSVLTLGSFYTFNGANALTVALFLLAPAATIVASLVGLWRSREWGWTLAVFVDGVFCVLTLLGFSEFDVSTVCKFAGLGALLLSPVRVHFLGQKHDLGLAAPLQGISDGASHYARLVSAPILNWTSQISPWKKVVAIFCFAGFLSAGIYVSYSGWITSLAEANEARYQRDMLSAYINVPHDAAVARAAEYARIGKYAKGLWPFLLFGFPSAIALSLLISIETGWFPRTMRPGIFPALIPLYAGPILAYVATLVFPGYFFGIGAILALTVFAYLLTLSASILASRWSWELFASIWISAVVCSYLTTIISLVWGPGDIHFHLANYSIVLMGMTWGGMYGWTLTNPDVPSKAGPPTIVRPQRKPV